MTQPKLKQLLLNEDQHKYLMQVLFHVKSNNVTEAGYQVSMYQMVQQAPDYQEQVEVLDGEG